MSFYGGPVGFTPPTYGGSSGQCPPQQSGYPQIATGYPAQAPIGYPQATSTPLYPQLPQSYPPAAQNMGYPGYSQGVISMPEPYIGGPAMPILPPAAIPSASLPYPVHPMQPAAPGYSTPQSFAPGSYVSAPAPSYPSASYPPTPIPNWNYPPAQLPVGGSSMYAHPTTTASGYAATPSYGSTFQGQGTIRPFPNFSAEFDSQMLRKAMKGFGTDEQTIINVLGQRSNQQRQQLKLTYKTLFGRDLVKDLSGELSFRFKQTILALMMTPIEYDADELYKAIRGLGTNEEVLVEILCTRTNQQIADIKNAYRMKYRNELERDLVGDTSGHFRRFVVSLVTAGRREDNIVDYQRAHADAMALYQAGEARWGTDESKFNQIFCAQSHTQLRAVFDEYQKIAHRSILQSLSREMSGDLYLGMHTLASVVLNPHKYFADRLHRCMKGAGTNDDTLIRVIVSRSEVDLVQIKHEFQRQYGQILETWIQDDTSGDYRKILLQLVRGN